MQIFIKIMVCILLVNASFSSITSLAAEEDATVDISPLNVEVEDANASTAIPPTEEVVKWDYVASNTNASPQKFSDIGPSHWARAEIYHLSELGVISGYNDGEFRPNLIIKRGQAANIYTSALKLKQIPYQPIFSDISANSSYKIGALATYNANIFERQKNGTFGANEVLTREQLATSLVRAFHLKDTGKAITFKDGHKIGAAHKQNVKILAQHNITTGDEKGNFNPQAAVSRATFTTMLYRALIKSGQLEKKTIKIAAAPTSGNFKSNNAAVNSVKVTTDVNPIYIRSSSSLQFKGSTKKVYDTGQDAIYNYNVDSQNAIFTLTVRTLNNGSKFVFSTLKNNSKKNITVDVYQITTNVTKNRLVRYDRYPIKAGSTSSPSYDLATAPTGLLQLSSNTNHILDRIVGKAYRSRALSQSYKSGGQSQMRELYSESENFSYITLKDKFYSFYTLASKGSDIVDSWYVESEKKLFKSEKTMESWMKETSANFKKRNNWYTSQGPYNKMATTTEPMPKSNRGYGRNLLLVKEDRALELLEQQGDLYFETIVLNSFINLQIFKGSDTYWYTEVTSTYLKNLYGITAPFVDTRFNEQIALFYLRAGENAGVKNYKKPLKNYADLLVQQVNKGNVISINSNAYYIPDYYGRFQNVKTHTSLNHLLGGVAILLHAYEKFGEQKYLNVARSVMNALQANRASWLRSNKDFWYKIDRNKKFSGDDYVHLTLEDLTYVYYLWSNIDSTYLPLLQSMIANKSSYLKSAKLGHTEKIKSNLRRIEMLKYLP